jgi:hypothetical protein
MTVYVQQLSSLNAALDVILVMSRPYLPSLARVLFFFFLTVIPPMGVFRQALHLESTQLFISDTFPSPVPIDATLVLALQP